MEVIELWRYPVKSLQGEPISSAELERTGLAGDRMWGIRDLATGRILTARRRPELLLAAAAYEGTTPVVTLPTGERVAGASPEGDALLSEWLDQPVSLVSSAQVDAGRAESFVDSTDDTSEMTEWTMPAGRFVDAAPILVVTTASLRHGASLYPEGLWDARRFRPNVLVEAEGDGWLEDAWLDRSLTIGSSVLVPSEACARCTMVTRPQPGGISSDVDMFRTLAKHHRGRFGVWSEVVQAGTVSVGDAVVLDQATKEPSVP